MSTGGAAAAVGDESAEAVCDDASVRASLQPHDLIRCVDNDNGCDSDNERLALVVGPHKLAAHCAVPGNENKYLVLMVSGWETGTFVSVDGGDPCTEDLRGAVEQRLSRCWRTYLQEDDDEQAWSATDAQRVRNVLLSGVDMTSHGMHTLVSMQAILNLDAQQFAGWVRYWDEDHSAFVVQLCVPRQDHLICHTTPHTACLTCRALCSCIPAHV
jgi:hypothetical protein